MAFDPGDIVCLKSGGPVMTVAASANGKVKCTWFYDDNTKVGEYEFDEVALEVASDEPLSPFITGQ